MRLRRLRLENYRRFREVEVEFPDGVIGLVGRNGSGKSTLVEAMAWAVYGHDAARTKKDYIKRRGAAPGDDCRVELEFDMGGHAYHVTRELLGANLSHAAGLTVDGKPAVQPGAGSAQKTTEYLARAFQMDRESFFTSVVARQKELNALSDMRPGERKEVILRMLRIDAVDEAIRLCRQSKRDLRAEMQRLEEELEALPHVEARLEEAKGALEGARDRAAQAAEALEAAEAEAKRLRGERDGLAERREAYEALRQRLEGARERARAAARELAEKREDLQGLDAAAEELAELKPRDAAYGEARERLARMQEARQAHRRAKELGQEVAAARKRREALDRRVDHLEGRCGELEPARGVLKRVRGRAAEVRDEAQRLDVDVTRAHGDLERLAAEAEAAWARREELLDLGAGTPCPTCERPLEGEHLDAVVREVEARLGRALESARSAEARLVERRGRLRALREELEALGEREEELLAKVEALSRVEGELAQAREARDEAAAEVAERKKALEAAADAEFDPDAFDALASEVERLATAHERVVALEARLERRPRVAEAVERLEAERQELAEAAEGLASELKALEFDPEAYRAVAHRYEAAQEAAAEAGKRRVAAQGEVERAKLVLEQARERRARLEKAEASLASLREDLRYLERLAGDRDSGVLVEFKVHLISRIRPVLAHHGSALFRELTDGRYVGLELDEDYNLLVHDDGEAFDLARFSGGEADLANLCVRLAIGQLIAERSGSGEFGFLALDEIFGSQDAVRRGNILHALAGLSARFRQILVITHVDDIKESVDHLLRVTEAEGDASRVVWETA